jgi:hypothetical protein
MILIYTDELNPRIDYTCRLIFSRILGSEILFTLNPDDLSTSGMPVFNYSKKKFGNEIYIRPHPLMYSRGLSKIDIQPVGYREEKYFFESSGNSVLPFDPLAASFYLVTRYEEYFACKNDRYNRFPARESILYKYGLLKKPVVNIWAHMLAEKMKQKYPELVFPSGRFKFLSTIDVDSAWAYAHKKFLRITGAYGRELLKGHFKETRERILVMSGKKQDPFFNFPYMDKIFSGNESRVIFFFPVGDYSRYDKNICHKNRHYRKLIQEISGKYPAGVHFSFLSGKKNKIEKFMSEVSRMEYITGSNVERSRQHYLLLGFPETYRILLEAGIREDHTMGYASQTGFRAGICTPYYFYDLEKDTPTELKIVPFQVMDATLQNYLGFTPEEAWSEINTLMQEVKKAGGLFVSLWHNDSLDEKYNRKGYRQVFEKMNRQGFQWSNE